MRFDFRCNEAGTTNPFTSEAVQAIYLLTPTAFHEKSLKLLYYRNGIDERSRYERSSG
jgi:hypothetical protein